MSFLCIGGAHVVNNSRNNIEISYKYRDDEYNISLGTNAFTATHCISPGWGENLNATVTIAPEGWYRITIRRPPFTEVRSFHTDTGFGLTATDNDTIVHIVKSNPPLGGPGDGPTKSIDRMKINTLILGDHTETTIEPEGPSEYSTRTNDTSTPFSAIFIDPITRVTVVGRSRDHAFYVSMLVTLGFGNYIADIIDEHYTPNLTVTSITGDEMLSMLETNVSREWSVYTVIS